MSDVSERALFLTLNALAPISEIGRQPHEIALGVQGYSLISVRHALRELCRRGLVRFDGPDCRRLYSITDAGREWLATQEPQGGAS